MKIAVTSTGKHLDDKVDPRFGRAAFILIIDTAGPEVEVIDNLGNIQAFKGAGIQAATTVSRTGAEVLLTGYCGPNAFKTLQAGGIKVVQDVGGTVREALALFNSGAMAYSASPNADGHW